MPPITPNASLTPQQYLILLRLFCEIGRPGIEISWRDVQTEINWKDDFPEAATSRSGKASVINGSFPLLVKMGYLHFGEQNEKRVIVSDMGYAWLDIMQDDYAAAEDHFRDRLGELWFAQQGADGDYEASLARLHQVHPDAEPGELEAAYHLLSYFGLLYSSSAEPSPYAGVDVDRDVEAVPATNYDNAGDFALSHAEETRPGRSRAEVDGQQYEEAAVEADLDYDAEATQVSRGNRYVAPQDEAEHDDGAAVEAHHEVDEAEATQVSGGDRYDAPYDEVEQYDERAEEPYAEPPPPYDERTEDQYTEPEPPYAEPVSGDAPEVDDRMFVRAEESADDSSKRRGGRSRSRGRRRVNSRRLAEHLDAQNGTHESDIREDDIEADEPTPPVRTQDESPIPPYPRNEDADFSRQRHDPVDDEPPAPATRRPRRAGRGEQMDERRGQFSRREEPAYHRRDSDADETSRQSRSSNRRRVRSHNDDTPETTRRPTASANRMLENPLDSVRRTSPAEGSSRRGRGRRRAGDSFGRRGPRSEGSVDNPVVVRSDPDVPDGAHVKVQIDGIYVQVVIPHEIADNMDQRQRHELAADIARRILDETEDIVDRDEDDDDLD